jgi:hypothetical protein
LAWYHQKIKFLLLNRYEVLQKETYTLKLY